ncbi:hypothetical protein AVEN_20506-1 [Araneus ventricosus]|uniref:Uncharacterized protein n=1 Tax=Araneus ventricosus TaxID=182803 RepID=A0A4Y2HY91_ARAVE|nr:hypothetical protein AVEN_20506-1 [Araneus ventricosus]
MNNQEPASTACDNIDLVQVDRHACPTISKLRKTGAQPQNGENHPYSAFGISILKHLDTLKSRLKATRRQFWDEPHNFEPWSDDKVDTLTSSSSSNLPIGYH